MYDLYWDAGILFSKLLSQKLENCILTELSHVKMQQQSSSQVMPYLYVIVLSFAFYVYDNPIEVGGAVIFIFVLQIRKAQRNLGDRSKLL